MQKIALPLNRTHIEEHFGHSTAYVLATLKDMQPQEMELIRVPSGCACSSDLLERLAGFGVTHIFAGTMGRGAYAKAEKMGFHIVRGCSGPYLEVLDAWRQGVLCDRPTECHHADGGCASH